MLGFFKIKKLRTIIIIYWILLAYIIAALIYWFLLLNQQNNILSRYKLSQAGSTMNRNEQLARIDIDKHRKEVQYLAEGSTFLLLIITGAIFVYRAVRRQLKQSQLQHNFMMALTHELKTPIAVTKLNLETLKKRKLSVEIQQKLISNTLEEANRLNDLCSNMLLASQLEAGGYRFIKAWNNLSEIIQSSVSDYSSRFPDRIFETQIIPGVTMLCDKLLMQMAINNILDNGIKYTTPSGAIQAVLDTSGDSIVIKISDHGDGISDAEKKKIFTKFYRIGNQYTKEAKGTGLGLYLSKTIVEQHKGKLQVFDNMPSGSIFQINFPSQK